LLSIDLSLATPIGGVHFGVDTNSEDVSIGPRIGAEASPSVREKTSGAGSSSGIAAEGCAIKCVGARGNPITGKGETTNGWGTSIGASAGCDIGGPNYAANNDPVWLP
jgi:hypothetical protein